MGDREAKIGGWDGKSHAQLYHKASQGRLNWDGSDSDFSIGDGFLEARFPVSQIRKLLGNGTPVGPGAHYQLQVALWRESAVGSGGATVSYFTVGPVVF